MGLSPEGCRFLYNLPRSVPSGPTAKSSFQKFVETLKCISPMHFNDSKEFLRRIDNRGPDSVQELRIKLQNDCTVYFRGSVLWMQGAELTPQPVENIHGVLLYNGDIFDESWDKSVSDTQIIMKKLSEIDGINKKQHILKVLKSLKGPFNLIYYDKSIHDLYFTRDRLGRGSLLFDKDKERFIISSVLGRKAKCVEIPATYIHCMNLNTKEIELHSWNGNLVQQYNLEIWLKNLLHQQNLPDEQYLFELNNIEDFNDEENIVQYISNAAMESKCKPTVMTKILENINIRETAAKLLQLLENSVRIRLVTQPKKCKNCLFKNSECNHCTVGVLFSGGLDCTILAFLADKYVHKDQPIDLINVAFQKDETFSYEVPDRLTGKQSFEELKKLCTSRTWIFREVNITRKELYELQKNNIADLVYPRKTILDESLGSALWFATRCKDENGVSPCRVLLLGSGADELFGGYLRHRNAFKYHGWQGLNKELMLDWKRISFRNLARDNRVICDHGRQPRMPYLDEDFTDYVLSLKPWLKCFPSEHLGPGIGDKLLLRLVAFKLGLTDVAIFPKRALQFGSRIANKREKGSDISKNFQNCKGMT